MHVKVQPRAKELEGDEEKSDFASSAWGRLGQKCPGHFEGGMVQK